MGFGVTHEVFSCLAYFADVWPDTRGVRAWTVDDDAPRRHVRCDRSRIPIEHLIVEVILKKPTHQHEGPIEERVDAVIPIVDPRRRLRSPPHKSFPRSPNDARRTLLDARDPTPIRAPRP
jgi:hypothetical protein